MPARDVLEKMMHVILAGCGGKVQMPIVGLGTWQASTEEVEDAVTTALESGYRHIDTAFNYNNEEAIGRALKNWFESGKGCREEVFITTKLPHIGNRARDAERFLNLSLRRLQLDYVDLYLVHLPFAFVCDETTLTPAVNEDGSIRVDFDTDNIATWKVLEEQVKRGKVKALGLSNFNPEQVRELHSSVDIKPSVVQVELHAHMQQKELRSVCEQLGVAVTAYAPLGSPGAKQHFTNKYNYSVEVFPDLLNLDIAKELAEKYKKTPSQILLRHLVQQDIIVIPKSANASRIKSNIDVFDLQLSEEDMGKLNELDKGEAGRIFDFLFWKGVETHPQYPFKNRLGA